MTRDRKCFIMVCLKSTEQECIEKGLFAEIERSYELIKGLEPDDIGFLLNIDTNTLIGPFKAVSLPGLDLEPGVWEDNYPAQIRVKPLVRHLKKVEDANSVLEEIGVKCDEFRLRKFRPRLPVHSSVIGKKLTEYVLRKGVPVSPTSTRTFDNQTGSEIIQKYEQILPDNYLEVMNQVAVEIQQKTYERRSVPESFFKAEHDQRSLKLARRLNICIVGEVTDRGQIIGELGRYLLKIGIPATDWDVEFYNMEKLKTGALSSLRKDRSRFSLAIIGQITSHKIAGVKAESVSSELKNGKYIDSIEACDPHVKLSPDRTVKAIDGYLERFRV